LSIDGKKHWNRLRLCLLDPGHDDFHRER